MENDKPRSHVLFGGECGEGDSDVVVEGGRREAARRPSWMVWGEGFAREARDFYISLL